MFKKERTEAANTEAADKRQALSLVPKLVSPQSGRGASILDYVKKEGRPGLASFLGNAFEAKQAEGVLTFFFDPRHANLIPMIKNATHLDHLYELVSVFFHGHLDIRFAVSDDPTIAAALEAEERAQQIVNQHPTVQYIMQKFNGKMLNCQIIGEKE